MRVVGPLVPQIILGHVGCIDQRLQGEESEVLDRQQLVLIQGGAARATARLDLCGMGGERTSGVALTPQGASRSPMHRPAALRLTFHWAAI